MFIGPVNAGHRIITYDFGKSFNRWREGNSQRPTCWCSLPYQDWNRQWAQSVRPIRIGKRIVIRPSWESVALQARDIEIVLHPKQAFGTGHHATTRMLLEWREDVIYGGESVMDVGAGSGILAMAALRLGAASAVGVECDPVAVDCARDYATENGCGDHLKFRCGTLEEVTGKERCVRIWCSPSSTAKRC